MFSRLRVWPVLVHFLYLSKRICLYSCGHSVHHVQAFYKWRNSVGHFISHSTKITSFCSKQLIEARGPLVGNQAAASVSGGPLECRGPLLCLFQGMIV